MLKLYGFPVSHYYNMVKHALLVKGVAFEEVLVMPGTVEAYLDISPLGKIPSIETEHGFLSETSAILEYIDMTFGQTPLSPSDPWAHVKMKELMQIIDLYIALQGRPLIAASMGLAQPEQAKIDEAAQILIKSFTAIAKLGEFKPYLLGEQMTLADIMLRYSLVVIKGSVGLPNLDVAGFVSVNLVDLIPELEAWERLMEESAASQAIDAVVAKEMPRQMAIQRASHK